MRVTVDTNVLFAALYNPFGASGFVFDRFIEGEITFALSVATYLEYQDVLHRPEMLEKLGIDEYEMRIILKFITEQADYFDIMFRWRPNLRDEADNMFIECAVRSQSKFLITSNIRDFTIQNELIFEDIRIVTPQQFVQYWRANHE